MTTEIPMLSDEVLADLNNRFTYHRPVEGQPERYEAIRDAGLEMALLIAKLCPGSRERSLAFTKIEEAVMHANAAIARHERPLKLGPGEGS